MRRLYQKIYLTIIVSLLLVVAIAGVFWRAGFESSPADQAFELAGELAAAALPPADAPAVVAAAGGRAPGPAARHRTSRSTPPIAR